MRRRREVLGEGEGEGEGRETKLASGGGGAKKRNFKLREKFEGALVETGMPGIVKGENELGRGGEPKRDGVVILVEESVAKERDMGRWSEKEWRKPVERERKLVGLSRIRPANFTQARCSAKKVQIFSIFECLRRRTDLSGGLDSPHM